MPNDRLLFAPDRESRRVEKTAAMPGVPSPSEYVDAVPGPTLAFAVRYVRWSATDGSVTLFLGAGDRDRPGIAGSDDAVELADYFINDLVEADWAIEED